MKRYSADTGIPSLNVALSEYMNAGELKKLAALTGHRLPSRKADLVDLVIGHLDGDGLRTVWQALDDLQKAAVAEVVHARSASFAADRFRAKYGCDPAWGSLDEYKRDAHPTALRFFFFGNGVMPTDLKDRLRAFVPPPVDASVATLDQLPADYDRPYERWHGRAVANRMCQGTGGKGQAWSHRAVIASQRGRGHFGRMSRGTLGCHRGDLPIHARLGQRVRGHPKPIASVHRRPPVRISRV